MKTKKIVEDDKTLIENTNLTEENNETVKDEKKSLKDKIINQKTALLVAGGGLITGTALGSIIDKNEEILIDTDNDNIGDTILTDENHDDIYNIETESEEIEEIEAEDDINNNNSNSHTFNINTAPHASEGTVTDNMSFSEAFGAARAELGAGGVFEWNGQTYSTFYATEVDENYNPTIDYVTTEDADYVANNQTNNIETIESENIEVNEEEVAEISNDAIEETTELEEVTEVENAEDIEEIIGTNSVETGVVEYDGEIASNVPDDVPDTELDDHNNDLIALNDDFDDMNDWA